MSNNDDERMSSTDHLLWLAGKHPDLAGTVVGIAIFDGVPTQSDLRSRFAHVATQVQRFRQRVVTNPLSVAPPRWELDPNFDLDNHLLFAPPAPTPRTLQDVLDLAAPKALEPFPSDRPLWEVTAVEDMTDGRFALVQKLHHALADGLSALQIQLELLDFEADAEPRTALPPDQAWVVPKSQVSRLGDALSWDLRQRSNAIRTGLEVMNQARSSRIKTTRRAAQMAASLSRIGQLPSAGLSPLLAGRSDVRNYRCLAVPLTAAKNVGKAAETKLNAVFLAGLARGLASYHHHHGQPLGQVRVGIPISTRTSEETGNQIAGARFVLPLGGPSPAEHLRTIQTLVGMHAAEPALGLVDAIGSQISRLPAPAAVGMLRRSMQGLDIQASNVPGSPLPMYLLGNEMIAQYPFGPTTTSAANVTLLSYQDALNMGVATNAAAIPDPDTFAHHLQKGFDEVLEG